MKLLFYYFLLFFIYSCLGWLVETIHCFILSKKIILNRGFLIGPYIPIYGTGAIVMVLFLTEYKKDPIVLFCMAAIYSGVIEYVTSYAMEKIFKARWWDYSKEKFNINGRICLKNLLLFGVLGLCLINLINPTVELFLSKIPNNIIVIISYIAFIIFIFDFCLTMFLISKLEIKVENLNSDATEEIDEEIKKLLKYYKSLYKRLFMAFPKLEFNMDKGNLFMNKIKEHLDDIDLFIASKKEKVLKLKAEIKNLKISNLDREYIQEEIEKLKENLRDVRKRKIK